MKNYSERDGAETMTRETTQPIPSLADLMVNYLHRPADAESLLAESEALGEVIPHDASVGFRADPRQAWQEARTALGTVTAASPSEWAGLVIRQEGMFALPMAAGNYPQRVRDLGILLGTEQLSRLCPTAAGVPAASPALKSWAEKLAKKGLREGLLAVGVLRSAGNLPEATALLAQLRNEHTGDSAELSNEEAANLWHAGRTEEAAKLWAGLPGTDAVLFNRGMSELFLGNAAEAVKHLRAVVTRIPESNPWHHLAAMYLELAEMRS
jgi:hypothetical protein